MSEKIVQHNEEVIKGELKEGVSKRRVKGSQRGKKGQPPWMMRTIAVFLQSETVVGLNKNSKNCLEIFQFSGKASASPCQRRDIMAQISVDTFHCEGQCYKDK